MMMTVCCRERKLFTPPPTCLVVNVKALFPLSSEKCIDDDVDAYVRALSAVGSIITTLLLHPLICRIT